MHGRVEWYGNSNAYGWCGVYAEIGEWAKAFIAWIPWGGPQIPVRFSFYAARLVNITLVELNYSDTDFYIEGLWDVYNVTLTYEPGEVPTPPSLTIELLVDDGNGTLSVTGDWTDFAVDITGIDLIKGTVTFYAIRHIGPIPVGDCSGPTPGVPDRRIDIWDLVHVAQAYGSTPGNPWIPNYDFSMDFDLDFDNLETIGIGLGELTTIAGNLGTEY
jgi:hypothetical protein